MQKHSVVSREEWLAARTELLEKEKEFSRLRDELSHSRRELPWIKVEKEYTFKGQDGAISLAELFGDKSQLIVYHFMFGPEWEAGCKSCSYVADHFGGAIVHLKQRDVAFAAISRAPLANLEAFKNRLGWSFPWYSALDSDFNFDYGVSFSPEDEKSGEVTYNYKKGRYFSDEAPGLSVFFKDENGDIYHTYSTYARGLDLFIGAYNFLDVTPKGRDEDDLPFTMAWVRYNDAYES